MTLSKTLDHVMLEDSWVLGWRLESDRLVFAIEASLWPGHGSYESPKPGEWTCYKRGRLVFEGVRDVQGLLDLNGLSPHTDPDGTQDFGSIDLLALTEGGFRIIGKFGDVLVQASSVRLDLE